MLRTLKDLFDAFTAPPAGQSPIEEAHALQLATAVLLVEVMRADPAITDAERDAVLLALQARGYKVTAQPMAGTDGNQMANITVRAVP